MGRLVSGVAFAMWVNKCLENSSQLVLQRQHRHFFFSSQIPQTAGKFNKCGNTPISHALLMYGIRNILYETFVTMGDESYGNQDDRWSKKKLNFEVGDDLIQFIVIIVKYTFTNLKKHFPWVFLHWFNFLVVSTSAHKLFLRHVTSQLDMRESIPFSIIMWCTAFAFGKVSDQYVNTEKAY